MIGGSLFPRGRALWWAGLTSLSLTVAQAQEVGQQAAIEALVKDLDYLIHYTEQLQNRYRQDHAPVRFNYPALLEQLRITRGHTADYLHERPTVVHTAPPRRVNTPLRKRR